METLVVAQPRTQYYNGSKSQTSSGGIFGSSPSSSFREISCRTFQSGVGILPNPFESFNKACSSPKTPPQRNCDEATHIINCGTSDAIVINSQISMKDRSFNSDAIGINSQISMKDRSFSDDFCYSELWAGPAYTNSPPPSSLPIPKFSLRQKRSISLELPVVQSSSGINVHQYSKSAPPSPTRESYQSSARNFSLSSTASATKDLRRILHLDIDDE